MSEINKDGNEEDKRLDALTKALEINKREITLEELENILSMTVFEDRELKLTLFLALLMTYTEDSQCNLVIKGASASGKSYNVGEILWFFPNETGQEILEFAGASPTSFIYRKSAKLVDMRTGLEWDKPRPKKDDSKELWDEWNDFMRNSALFLDYHQKIIVFPDNPDTRLLAKLRSVLSHDKKDCMYSVTDKTKSGLRAKDIIVRGFFTNIFCTASSPLDDQEMTRNFLLSPTDDKSKILKSLELIARKGSDVEFRNWYETEPLRVALKKRIEDIKHLGITHIYIPKELMQNLKDWFIITSKNIGFKAQRDFPRLISLAKGWAILNFMCRQKSEDGKILYCNEKDIEVAEILYAPILECNELGLTPEEYEIYKILHPHDSTGLTVKEAYNLYYAVKKQKMGDKRFRGMLENFCRSGLFREEKNGQTLMYYGVGASGQQELNGDAKQ